MIRPQRVFRGTAVGILVILVVFGWITDWQFGSTAWSRLIIAFESPQAWRGRLLAHRQEAETPVLYALSPYETYVLGIDVGERTGTPDVDYCTVRYIDEPSESQRRDLAIYAPQDIRPEGLEPGQDLLGCTLAMGGFAKVPIRVEVLENGSQNFVKGFNREILHILWKSQRLD